MFKYVMLHILMLVLLIAKFKSLLFALLSSAGVKANTVGQEIVSQHEQLSNRLHGNADPGTVDTRTNLGPTDEQNASPLQGILVDASIFRAAAVKFGSFLKQRGNLQLSLVIAFSVILLLMQVWL